MQQLIKTSLTAGLALALVSACSSDSSSVRNPCKGAEVGSVRLFLQQLTATSVILKWRGDADEACVGVIPTQLKGIYGAV